MSENAARLYRHVERYLTGACNEEALEAWRLAVAQSIQSGLALDAAIGAMATAYLSRAKRARP